MEHTEVKSRQISESSDMLIGEGYALKDPRNIPGFKETTNFKPKYAHEKKSSKKKNLISKFFSNMSRLGMTYEEDVISNMRAIPADKALMEKQDQFLNQDLFSKLNSPWKVKSNADKNFFEKDFPAKREALRKLASQPELEEILDTMADESIVYDQDFTYFMEPFIELQELQDFKPEIRDKINNTMNIYFRKFYKMLNWKINGWNDFKRFLIEGILAWEIVYDNLSKPSEIIGLIPLDPATLTRKFENNKFYWIQFKGVTGRERTLLDSQVIYVSYQDTGCTDRLSYLERLIRPFNIYRIIEQAQLIWTITNSAYRTKFTIPVKGMSKMMGMQTLSSAMNRYKEDIKFVTDTGELSINGQVTMPFNKEYWFPETESGSPEIETLGGDGPELNDNDQLKFFKNQLYKVSKIPMSRFDQESGETWFGTDATSAARTEISFGRFVTRLRNTFSTILIKPIQLILAIKYPELQDNRQFLGAVSMQYKSYNLFEEMMEMELMQKRVEFIQTMKESMIDMDVEGNEIKFFSSKFLVKKFLKFSDADLKLNDKLKKEEIDELNLAGSQENMQDGALESLSIDSEPIIEAKKKRPVRKSKQIKLDPEDDEEKNKEEE